jgi:hypothetical protein
VDVILLRAFAGDFIETSVLNSQFAFGNVNLVIKEVRARGGMMRITLNIVASLLVPAGAIWFLQGINVLPGSFMTGQTRWAVYGGIAVAVGIGLLLRANRLRRDH